MPSLLRVRWHVHDGLLQAVQQWQTLRHDQTMTSRTNVLHDFLDISSCWVVVKLSECNQASIIVFSVVLGQGLRKK